MITGMGFYGKPHSQIILLSYRYLHCDALKGNNELALSQQDMLSYVESEKESVVFPSFEVIAPCRFCRQKINFREVRCQTRLG